MICLQKISKNTYVDTVTSQFYEWLWIVGKFETCKTIGCCPLHGHLTITVGHMIYLLMWPTDSCLQIYSTKSKGTSDNNLDPKWKLQARRCMCSETLLIFLVCTFLCFIFLMHYISFARSVFALGLQSI